MAKEGWTALRGQSFLQTAKVDLRKSFERFHVYQSATEEVFIPYSVRILPFGVQENKSNRRSFDYVRRKKPRRTPLRMTDLRWAFISADGSGMRSLWYSTCLGRSNDEVQRDAYLLPRSAIYGRFSPWMNESISLTLWLVGATRFTSA